MHPGIEFCINVMQQSLRPELNLSTSSSSVFYKRAAGGLEWNYAWELAGAVYRSGYVSVMLDLVQKTFGWNPNSCEEAGHR